MELHAPTNSSKYYLSSGELVGKRVGYGLSGFAPTNQMLTAWATWHSMEGKMGGSMPGVMPDSNCQLCLDTRKQNILLVQVHALYSIS